MIVLLNLALVKLTPVRVAPTKFAFVNEAPLKSALNKLQLRRMVAVKSAPPKFASVSEALSKLAEARLAETN